MPVTERIAKYRELAENQQEIAKTMNASYLMESMGITE